MPQPSEVRKVGVRADNNFCNMRFAEAHRLSMAGKYGWEAWLGSMAGKHGWEA